MSFQFLFTSLVGILSLVACNDAAPGSVGDEEPITFPHDLQEPIVPTKNNPNQTLGDVVKENQEYEVPLGWKKMSEKKKYSSLLKAIKERKEKKALLLIEKGAPIHKSYASFGATVLHWAAFKGLEKVVNKLIEKGAKVNSIATGGKKLCDFTPLHDAAKSKYENPLIAKKILDVCPEIIDYKSSQGHTALHIAVINNNKKVVKVILSRNPDLNTKNNEGNTPIISAVLIKDKEMVKMLLRKKPDLNIESDGGWTPYELAKNQGFTEIANLINEAMSN